jgi:hypothetical protein
VGINVWVNKVIVKEGVKVGNGVTINGRTGVSVLVGKIVTAVIVEAGEGCFLIVTVIIPAQ